MTMKSEETCQNYYFGKQMMLREWNKNTSNEAKNKNKKT